MKLQDLLKISVNFGWIKTIPEAEQEEAELMHDEWLGVLHDAERERYKDVELMRKEIRAWKEEPGMVAFAKAARLRYLKWQKVEALKAWEIVRTEYIEALRVSGEGSDEVLALERTGLGISKKIHGYEISIAVLEGRVNKKDLITDEMIERAREYPIKSLLEVGPNTRAKCVFHGGEGYNLDIRKNFAHCYVCGESGDTIRVYRAKHEASFREAILALQ